ncbi:MAG: hypothetical protein ACUVQZ_10305 [Candidatus Caldatribacteriaceae bacterium]
MKSYFNFFFSGMEEKVQMALEKLSRENIIERMWRKDYTVWSKNPQEIENRLDWLSIIEEVKPQIVEWQEFSAVLSQEGFQQVMLLGMGGSSLAPELFSRVFLPQDDVPNFFVLDTTDAETISWYTDKAREKKTLYIVSTKSGNTLETLTLFRYFFSFLQQDQGIKNPGEYFVAITDPGSPLEKLAREHYFRRVFLNNPNIGGRYSAFSLFGLVPAVLAGVDVRRILQSGEEGMRECSPNLPLFENVGVLLGAMVGILAQQGRDKLTLFFSSPKLLSLGDWIEQLVAESTGKDGKGVLPVIEPFPREISEYGEDRWFVLFDLHGSSLLEQFSQKARQRGFPLLHVRFSDLYSLGEQMFLWEFATALAGYFLQINPFDQPNVEETKILTKKRIAELITSFQENVLSFGEHIKVLPSSSTFSLQEELKHFFSKCSPGSYIVLQAFLPYRQDITEELWKIASLLGHRTRCAVTVGYGPRFLHSTGQLHKGDAGKGLFIQFLSRSLQRISIPGENFDFDFLKEAQALGDREALQNRGRQVVTFFIADHVLESLVAIRELFASLSFLG